MRVNVLDHGFVELVESWGSDEAIIEAARQSTQKGFLGWGDRWKCSRCATVYYQGGLCLECKDEISELKRESGDEKLLRFLWENKHSTPFEFAGMTIRVKGPIFVFREWHRHRTQSYSEASARYAPLPCENYVPTVERLLANSKTNAQAGTVKGSAVLTPEGAEGVRIALRVAYDMAEEEYQRQLALGVPKELARIVLPVGRYSQMVASTDLRNWLGFLALRQAPNAQLEIRQYADAVARMVAEKFPRTHALFEEGRK